MLAGRRHERAVIGCIAKLLLNERNAGDVDCLEPCFNLGRLALTDVDRERRIDKELLFVFLEALKIFRFTFTHDRKRPRVCNESRKRRDALLSDQEFILTVRVLDKVDKPERITLQQ